MQVRRRGPGKKAKNRRFGFQIVTGVPARVNGKKNPDYHHAYSEALRVMALEKCGGPVCKWCGEQDKDCLDIDHINDDGAQDRRIYGSSNDWHAAIISGEVDTTRLQVLCANDNRRKQRAKYRMTRKTALDNITEPVLD